jgi:hypothetical protein
VLVVNLRNAECDEKNLVLLSRLIYDGMAWLVVFRAGKML